MYVELSCLLVQLNIAAASGFGSRMSLNQTSDEADDDDFGDAISMVHGMIPVESEFLFLNQQ